MGVAETHRVQEITVIRTMDLWYAKDVLCYCNKGDCTTDKRKSTASSSQHEQGPQAWVLLTWVQGAAWLLPGVRCQVRMRLSIFVRRPNGGTWRRWRTC